MAKPKRNIMDELGERARHLIDELERLLQPRRQPVRVPVPVRIPQHDRRR